MDEKKTKFEQDLQSYFPEIAKLNMYGKFDEQLWEAINILYEFYDGRLFGKLEINFQDGKINHITTSIRREKKR